ncbi:uncharacterized protein LOC135834198 [Planococcus citri]|uniref:uncharacterized protein LOC135834198 n=1 Tax=Planococcus citri TaxID=170843 RepID=UPI0031F8B17B
MPALTLSPLSPETRRRYVLKVETALMFLDEIKYKYIRQPQVYNDFLNIMTEFKSQKIDTPGVINRVMHLFKDNPELIQGFNAFLPPGYKIDVVRSVHGNLAQASVSVDTPTSSSSSSVSPNQPVILPTFNYAINFVNKVKYRFRNEPDKYQNFLEILHTYQRDVGASFNENTSSGRGSLEVDVFVKVTRLFENHNDLVQDFVHMLPPGPPLEFTAAFYPVIIPEE